MLSLAWPWLLALLPLPWLCYWRLPPALVQNSALRVPFFKQLHQLPATTARYRRQRRLRLLLLICIWLLLVLAAARPQLLQQLPPQPEQSNSYMLAIDLSNSMNIQDANPQQPEFSRLDLVKLLAQALLQQHPDDRFGLIFFASQPYLQSPLTHDHHSLLHWLQLAQAGMIGERTAIGDAIGLAIKQLRPDQHNKKTIILITDGANNSGSLPPLSAAGYAAELGLTIHSIGIGSTEQASAHDLDEQLLQQLAQTSGGHYLRISNLQQLPQLLELLAQLEPVQLQQIQLQHIELYRTPLLAAFMLALMFALHNLYGYLRQHAGKGGAHV